MDYYLDLFTPETWEAFKAHGTKVSGFRERQRKTADRIKPGDRFVCYLVRLSRWCGILEVTSKVFIDNDPIFSNPDPFIVRFEVKPIVVLDIDKSIPILDEAVWSKLSMTKNIERGRQSWAQIANVRASLRLL
jgi:predicted RNA-binding protein